MHFTCSCTVSNSFYVGSYQTAPKKPVPLSFLIPRCNTAHRDRSSLLCHTLKVHPELNQFNVCRLCDRLFDNNVGLHRHLKKAHRLSHSGTLKCPFCPAWLPSMEMASIHRVTLHTGALPVHCPFCGAGKLSSLAYPTFCHTQLLIPLHSPLYLLSSQSNNMVNLFSSFLFNSSPWSAPSFLPFPTSHIHAVESFSIRFLLYFDSCFLLFPNNLTTCPFLSSPPLLFSQTLATVVLLLFSVLMLLLPILSPTLSYGYFCFLSPLTPPTSLSIRFSLHSLFIPFPLHSPINIGSFILSYQNFLHG